MLVDGLSEEGQPPGQFASTQHSPGVLHVFEEIVAVFPQQAFSPMHELSPIGPREMFVTIAHALSPLQE